MDTVSQTQKAFLKLMIPAAVFLVIVLFFITAPYAPNWDWLTKTLGIAAGLLVIGFPFISLIGGISGIIDSVHAFKSHVPIWKACVMLLISTGYAAIALF